MGTVTTPDKTLDLRDMSCTQVLHKTKGALDEMEAGMVLEVLSSDACSEYDMPTWVKRTGKKMLDTVQEEGAIKFIIQKL